MIQQLSPSGLKQPDRRNRYRVDLYDPNDDPKKNGRWKTFRKSVSARTVVKALRQARSMGYDDNCSIYVELIKEGGSG